MILLRYNGEAFDPTGEADADRDTWQAQILGNLGLAPAWSCRGGVNTVRLTLPKAHGVNTLLLLLIAAIAASVVGAAGSCLPETLRAGLSDYLLTPIFNAFLGLINTLAGLMIFLTVSSGVFGVGDTASLNRIGKVTFPRFIGIMFAASAITIAVSAPFMNLHMETAAQGESQLGQISEMIFDILPKNPIRPFLDGNMMQIIALAMFTGVTLLLLGDRMARVSALIEDLGGLVRTMMELVCGLIPLLVFVSLIELFWPGSVENILGLWKPLCVFLLASAILTALALLMTSLRTKTSPGLLLRKGLPSFLVAFSTASSMTAFPACESACIERFGISKRLFDFGFPIGMIVYMPISLVPYVVVPAYLAEVYSVKVDISWFVLAGILATALTIAIPPGAGGALSCYGILLAQLNIPAEGMLMCVALDIVMDFFCTGLDILVLEWELLCQADTLNMLDREKLDAA